MRRKRRGFVSAQFLARRAANYIARRSFLECRGRLGSYCESEWVLNIFHSGNLRKYLVRFV